MKDTKILYLIYSSTKESGGGHFYSLKTISTSLGRHLNYRILNLGYTHGQVLRNSSRCDYIGIHRSNFLFKILSVYRYIKAYKPDILHAFDFNSLFIARTVAIFLKVRVVFTKAGGRNTANYIPDTDGSIFFSLENYNYYTNHSVNPSFNVLIPNRVDLNIEDHSLNEDLVSEYNLNGKFVLLRISRFNSYYDKTFKQAISLLKKTLTVRPNAVLVLIGRIQSQEYFSQLREGVIAAKLPVEFVTEEKFTRESSVLLPVAKIVIATGRGVMEASSLNKIIFCPISDQEYPVLLNDSTFPSLFKTNFSERGRLDSTIQYFQPNAETIFDENYDPKTKVYFEEYFNINNVISKYLDFYELKQYSKFRILNYIGHLVRFFK